MELRFNPLDTTSFALTGDSVPASDEPAMTITHGYAKDPRPDVQQAVLALLVSQDGGVPWRSKSWDGPTSDTQMFQERAQAWMAALGTSPRPRSLVADAQLAHEANAMPLQALGCITRLPHTLSLVPHVLTQARRGDTWHELEATTR